MARDPARPGHRRAGAAAARSTASASTPGAWISPCSARTARWPIIPRHYRDARTNGVMEKVFAVVPRAEVFAQTGIQFMQLNSLYQFYALKLAGSPALARRAHAAVHAGPAELLADGRGARGADHRQHVAVLRSAQDDLGRAICWSASACPPTSFPKSCRPVRDSARCSIRSPRPPAWVPCPSTPPDATTRRRPWPPCPPRARTGATSAPAPGR